MDSRTPNLQLTGGSVISITPGTRKVSQGIFRLENREATPFCGSFNAAWLKYGSGRQIFLPEIIVYETSLGQPLEPQQFTVGAQASLPIEIDFVAPDYEPDYGKCTAVGLRLEVGGVSLEALSPVVIVRAANGG